jgi:hypothetical protein
MKRKRVMLQLLPLLLKRLKIKMRTQLTKLI